VSLQAGMRDIYKSTFWKYVDAQDGAACWRWKGHIAVSGYGKFSTNPGTYQAHRAAYLLCVGPIPEGLEIDHLCRNRACVNPLHLEPVTRRENVLRGENRAAHQARQTHCKRGHEFNDANTLVTKARRRICRACRRQSA
jgi:hypothetical protein